MAGVKNLWPVFHFSATRIELWHFTASQSWLHCSCTCNRWILRIIGDGVLERQGESLQIVNMEDLWTGDPRKAGAQNWSSPWPLSKPSFFCSQVFFGYDPSSSTSLLSSVMDHRKTFCHNCQMAKTTKTLKTLIFRKRRWDMRDKWMAGTHTLFH